jgi:regulator of cell morphogenesis and NO signaling
MRIEPSTTIGLLAAGIPGATQIFESVHIDYCCRGARSLAEACADAGLDSAELIAELERAASGGTDWSDEARWGNARLTALMKHIVERHHVYTREELTRLDELSRKVLEVHGAAHPELYTLRALFEAIDRELRPHMTKEEVILFPYIEELEASRRAGRGRPFAPFGSDHGPIRAMMHDHHHVGGELRRLRALTDDYSPPPDACASWKSLYFGLEALEHDLFEHMHLESNLLFPRVLELERT